MEASEVSALHNSMRKYGIPGDLKPEDPTNPTGPWRVVDSAGQDVTDATLAAAAAAEHRRPERGFVITP
ncbi:MULTISPECIES: hypothetical protein [Streptomyces]|uniref:Uncharacterized protein n=1 Tax=Streptomyces venezuelae (strain ATCC 10712 / CBS 650.69 / DSM 40230 / JCM 4526 / NBRC 13096 / PD 04745) TaxID=953739 RepID=F2R7L7_STRVP|nr:hypothetical protein [Streptomyces venezuelae]APE22167.1 hypothetical protein vnz_14830 [Streptomyces venezuelae]QER99550.1 hypothetical protein DEJ43_15010 [Streptomyces venezuelae ATCC 10712]CCA56302.1 hypothetical protein SVEN_3016 [Streptomyces venezuelae ATCC 10712]